MQCMVGAMSKVAGASLQGKVIIMEHLRLYKVETLESSCSLCLVIKHPNLGHVRRNRPGYLGLIAEKEKPCCICSV